MEPFVIEYRFYLGVSRKEVFKLDLDQQTLRTLAPLTEPLPQWAELEVHQCEHCPLKAEVDFYCPLAARLHPVVERFDDILSYHDVELEVVTEDRNIVHKTSAQRALSSLMGLIMATSGCPHTAFFRPMARFHLPLANPQETIYRAVSTYLLSQYFVRQSGGGVDMDLVGLRTIYDNIHQVNMSVCNRLRLATKSDSSLNALSLLDLFALDISLTIDDSLEELAHMFDDHVALVQSK